MSSRFAIVLIAIIMIFGGIFFVTKNKANAPSGGGSSSSSAQSTNHTKGSDSTGVTLVEYADFQCPGCAAYYPVVKQVVDTYKDRITFQFVNYPLYQIHQNAMAAHRAAEAASMQGKFWEMYDLLYTGHSEWSNSNAPNTYFEKYASQTGLDVNKFKQDAASSKVNDILWADIHKGDKLNVNSTPTFFVDGKQLTSKQEGGKTVYYLGGKKLSVDPIDVAGFSKMIDDAIKEKSAKN